jgi:hypothetical protein
VNQIETKFDKQIQFIKNTNFTYFDENHPNFKMFSIRNNHMITLSIDDGNWRHISSPVKISETFTSFSYKVIKTSKNYIIYGIGSSELKNNQPTQYINNDFIGYYG